MTIRRRKPSSFTLRQPEYLETRDLLSGHSLAAVFAHFAAADAQFASHHSSTAAVAAQVFAHHSVFAALGSDSAESKTALTAELTDANSSATGTATFKTYVENGVTETKFKVTVKGAAANSTLDVSIGDAVVGQITTDDNGAGKLVLSSNPDGDEQSLPANFPTSVAAGAAVSVGSLSGSLATPPHSGSHCSSTQRTGLNAQLTDATSSATGTVNYQSNVKAGVTTTKLAVTISGATASSTLDVSIDGTVVGQLTTDDTGAGKLVLSSNPRGSQQPLPTIFPTSIAAGSTVSVGSLTGTLASSTNSSTNSAVRFARHR